MYSKMNKLNKISTISKKDIANIENHVLENIVQGTIDTIRESISDEKIKERFLLEIQKILHREDPQQNSLILCPIPDNAQVYNYTKKYKTKILGDIVNNMNLFDDVHNFLLFCYVAENNPTDRSIKNVKKSAYTLRRSLKAVIKRRFG